MVEAARVAAICLAEERQDGCRDFGRLELEADIPLAQVVKRHKEEDPGPDQGRIQAGLAGHGAQQRLIAGKPLGGHRGDIQRVISRRVIEHLRIRMWPGLAPIG